ncbi:cyclic nucleotide-binding/CBS domain-containing protein [Desulfosarcina ovata]|uniref:CBS domain-containing protein n=1 Tax=Desulfosarcina ovata subsp. ovata TaxID=2752305 RepID=A0A5K8A7V1_9BACT|nr:CBS domain-containing protein [Desulfosarcina ovata]BBO88615.1 hypothetical protein DSCOOX_17950 [Desulfosarcina ovata subsp. ovata]
MPVARTRSVLSGMRVREAMRRQMVIGRAFETARRGVARMIKYKSDCLLITDDEGASAGVVTKTDMTGAYYVGLPVDTLLGEIMMGPPTCCFPDDPLEDALETMGREQVHQLFVKGADADQMEGVLTYGDILGLVYRYCRRCNKSRFRKDARRGDGQPPDEALVETVMTTEVPTCGIHDDLFHVMEMLSAQPMHAALINDPEGRSAGVISKSDLVMGWYREVDPQTTASMVMSRPVHACHRRDSLTDAIGRMLLADLGRIFVHDSDPTHIVGVMSLADAARHRSGTCRACVSSRLIR